MSINIWKVSTLALAGTVAYGIATADNVASADGQAQPHMKAALVTLNTAKNQLEKASTDKGGHRALALKLTKEAIEETKKGIAFDETHKGDGKDVGTEEAIDESLVITTP